MIVAYELQSKLHRIIHTFLTQAYLLTLLSKMLLVNMMTLYK